MLRLLPHLCLHLSLSSLNVSMVVHMCVCVYLCASACTHVLVCVSSVCGLISSSVPLQILHPGRVSLESSAKTVSLVGRLAPYFLSSSCTAMEADSLIHSALYLGSGRSGANTLSAGLSLQTVHIKEEECGLSLVKAELRFRVRVREVDFLCIPSYYKHTHMHTHTRHRAHMHTTET